MREILFRGKRIDNGEWVYGYLVIKYIHFQNDIYTYIFTPNSYGGFIEHPLRYDTECQYTGRTDKNETKIFEGDIIRVDWLNARGTEVAYSTNHLVGFENGVFGACIDNEFMGFNECFSGDPQYCPYTYEVIGNIYDNPELLENQSE